MPVQWSRGLRRSSAAARLLRLWVRIAAGVRISVSCECCVLSGRGLCDELITRPEESYRLWCVVVCDLETSWMRRPWPHWGGGAVAPKKKWTSHCPAEHPATSRIWIWTRGLHAAEIFPCFSSFSAQTHPNLSPSPLLEKWIHPCWYPRQENG